MYKYALHHYDGLFQGSRLLGNGMDFSRLESNVYRVGCSFLDCGGSAIYVFLFHFNYML